MDNETWYITTATALGGFIGWLFAKLKVSNLCRDSTTNEVFGFPEGFDRCEDNPSLLADIVADVYPSSILTGLALGLLAGVLFVMWIRRFEGRDSAESRDSAEIIRRWRRENIDDSQD